MAQDLVFPRLVYRGEPDTLGTGQDAAGRTLNSETKKVNSQDELDAAEKEGWRLTREPADETAARTRTAAAETKAAEKPARK